MTAIDETERLKALRDLRVLDSQPEPVFDSLTHLAAMTFVAPIALISLIDDERQWFKACIGLDIRETGRDVAFCDHAIRQDDPLVVLDASEDPRFAGNPLVTGDPGIRFYAGAPLILRPGIRLGTLCVIDTAPRAAFDDVSRQQLAAMAASVTAALSLRRDVSNYRTLEREREARDRLLEQIEGMAGIGHWTLDSRTTTTAWSPSVYAIHGMDPSGPSPTYEQAVAAYEPEHRLELDALVKRALATGEPFALQARIRRPDGSVRYVKTHGEARRDDSNVIVGLAGVFMDVTEVVTADEAIRTNEGRLKFLTENAADVIMRLAPEHGVTWVSPNVRQFGYEPEQLLAMAMFDFVHPDDSHDLRRVLAALLAGDGDTESKLRRFRFRRTKGGWHWFEFNATTVRNAHGDPVEVVNVLRDVTARVDAEEAQAQSEARFRFLADNASDIIACFGTDTRFTYLSPSIKVVLGYSPEELVGQSTRTIMHPDDYRTSLSTYQAHLAGDRRREPFMFEYRAIHKDGSIVRLAAHPRAVFDPTSGEIAGFQDVVRNVTTEHAMAQELVRSEMRFRLLAENASDLVMESQADGRLAYISPACFRLTGYSQDEVIGHTAQAWVHPDDWPTVVRAFQAQVQSRAQAPATLIEYRLLTRDGDELWMESAPRALVNPATGEITVTDVARDVTARRKLAAALAAARDAAESAAQVKADFMANMSHELRTPLTAIIGFAGLLKGTGSLGDRERMFAERVSSSSHTLLALVNDILDFSKLEAGQVEIKPRPVQPVEILSDALNLFAPQAKAKGLELGFIAEGKLPAALLFDPDRLGQILLNLIGNAVKFTETGSVTVVAAYQVKRQQLEVRVEDTGAGLSKLQQQKLFLRFSQIEASSTRRHGGTGLGLAISKGLVEAMGGDIGVRSRKGHGSCFHFTITAPPADLALPKAIPKAATA